MRERSKPSKGKASPYAVKLRRYSKRICMYTLDIVNKRLTLEILTFEFYLYGIFTGIAAVCYIFLAIITFVFGAPIITDLLHLVLCAAVPTVSIVNFTIAYGFKFNAIWAWLLAIFEMALIAILGVLIIIYFDSFAVFILGYAVYSLLCLLINFKIHFLKGQNV